VEGGLAKFERQCEKEILKTEAYHKITRGFGKWLFTSQWTNKTVSLHITITVKALKYALAAYL